MSSHSSRDGEEVDHEPEPRVGENDGYHEAEEDHQDEENHEVVAWHEGDGMPVQGYTFPDRHDQPQPKINLKLITIEPFSGEIRDGYFDAGAHEWFERLQAQIEDAENLNGCTWPEVLKCSVLTSHLTGTAGTWRIRNRSLLPRNSFRDLGRALKNKFRSRLSVQQLSMQLAQAAKLPQESYDEYAHRLSQIATGLNQGMVTNYTEQQALSTFVNLAYPRFRDTLLAQIDVEAEAVTDEFEKAINLLSRLAGSDGRMKKRRYEAASADAGKKPRMGTAALVHSKLSKKPRDRWDFSDALCRICNQRGHTTNYHDRHVAQQQRARSTSQASGKAAVAAEPSDEE